MKENVIVRKAIAADLQPINRLEQLCFNEESFSRNQLRYLITRAKADFLVVEGSGAVSAFIVLLKHKTSKGLRIYSIAVSPACRGKGLARLLLDEAEKRARSNGKQYLTLEVSAINKEAIGLYLHSGFEIYGERLAYYINGSKALLMRKSVSN